MSGPLFQELERRLEERGMILKKGTLMDATLVEAQVCRPSLEEGRGARSSHDPDAKLKPRWDLHLWGDED